VRDRIKILRVFLSKGALFDIFHQELNSTILVMFYTTCG